MSTQKHMFEQMLQHFADRNAKKWHIVVQACQFDHTGFEDAVDEQSGKLVFNISPTATRHFYADESDFSFELTRGGVSYSLSIPYTAVDQFYDPDEMFGLMWTYYRPQTAPGKPYKLPKPTDRTSGQIVNEVLLKTDDKFDFPTGENMYIDTSKLPDRSLKVIQGGLAGTPKPPKAVKPVIKRPQSVHAKRHEKATPVLNAHFPDLDVSKIVFRGKKVKRPDWLTVHDGGKL